MLQISDVIANENVRYERNELEYVLTTALFKTWSSYSYLSCEIHMAGIFLSCRKNYNATFTWTAGLHLINYRLCHQ